MGVAEDKGYSQEYGRIAKVRYSHDAMIDLIIAEPMISQNKLAEIFGYSVPWVSRVYGSDAFQARLAERKAELVDPAIVEMLESRMKGVMIQSLDIIADKLEATKNADLALKAFDSTSKAMGFGARDTGAKQVNNFVVQLPGKAVSAQSWADAYAPKTPQVVIDHSGPIDVNG